MRGATGVEDMTGGAAVAATGERHGGGDERRIPSTLGFGDPNVRLPPDAAAARRTNGVRGIGRIGLSATGGTGLDEGGVEFRGGLEAAVGVVGASPSRDFSNWSTVGDVSSRLVPWTENSYLA